MTEKKLRVILTVLHDCLINCNYEVRVFSANPDQSKKYFVEVISTLHIDPQKFEIATENEILFFNGSKVVFSTTHYINIDEGSSHPIINKYVYGFWNPLLLKPFGV